MSNQDEQEQAWDALRAHRWWDYRGCAPDPDDRAVCAADQVTPISAWITPDAQETQPQRLAREAAAKAVCASCPILNECRPYAMAYEKYHLWAGMTATERRHARRRAARTPQPVEEEATTQRTTVLVALAAHTQPERVATAAGVDVRTANWQRSRLVTTYGLDPQTATRMDLLYAARAAGHLPADTVLVADGPRPVAAIPSQQHHLTPPQPRRGTASRARARARVAAQLALSGMGPASSFIRTAGASTTAAASTGAATTAGTSATPGTTVSTRAGKGSRAGAGTGVPAAAGLDAPAAPGTGAEQTAPAGRTPQAARAGRQAKPGRRGRGRCATTGGQLVLLPGEPALQDTPGGQLAVAS